MRSDAEIRQKGFQVLFEHMDVIEAEKFITLINRDRFDYTKWRHDLLEDKSIEEIITEARAYAIDFRKIEGQV
jgi:hypothetical protein